MLHKHITGNTVGVPYFGSRVWPVASAMSQPSNAELRRCLCVCEAQNERGGNIAIGDDS